MVNPGRGCCICSLLEQGTVASDQDRGAAVQPALEGNFTPRSPATAFEQTGERKVSRVLAEPLAYTRRQTIEQRHGQGSPFDDRLAQRIEGTLQERGVTRLD